ncbi:MAG: hypothetical protein P8J14_06700, partial [Emcibacteraceae bacterium]|nr:hypothetical protein [Emcibacteraceae bacterium]
MVNANFIYFILHKIFAIVIIFIFGDVVFNNYIYGTVFIAIYITLGAILNSSVCPNCNTWAIKHPDGFYLRFIIPLNCRFCGESFICKSFNKRISPVRRFEKNIF